MPTGRNDGELSRVERHHDYDDLPGDAAAQEIVVKSENLFLTADGRVGD